MTDNTKQFYCSPSTTLVWLSMDRCIVVGSDTADDTLNDMGNNTIYDESF